MKKVFRIFKLNRVTKVFELDPTFDEEYEDLVIAEMDLLDLLGDRFSTYTIMPIFICIYLDSKIKTIT